MSAVLASIPIGSIRSDNTYRKGPGNLTELQALADSIKQVGLLHPVVIGPGNQLIAGSRRVRACELLGWKSIPATRADTLSDAIQQLRAQRDENTCRVDFTPSEAVALGLALEELERPRAEANRLGNLKKGQQKPEVDNGPFGKTRDVVGPAVGMSGKTYERAKTVVEAAAKDKSLAPIVAEMDETGNVAAALRRLKLIQQKTEPKPQPLPAPHIQPVTASPWRTADDVLANLTNKTSIKLDGDRLHCASDLTVNLGRTLAELAGRYAGRRVRFLLAVKLEEG